MTIDKLRILVIDDEDDFLVIKNLLMQNSTVTYILIWAETFQHGCEELNTSHFDICLCRYHQGDRNIMEFLRHLAGPCLNIPIILITGMNEDCRDIKDFRAGAVDCLRQDRMDGATLDMAIRNLWQRKKIEVELFNTKEYLQATLDSISEAVIIANKQKEISHINHIGEELLGQSFAELEGKAFNEVVRFYNEIAEIPVVDILATAMYSDEIVRFNDNLVLVKNDGTVNAIEATVSPVHNCNNEVIGTITVVLDVTKARELSKKISYQATHDTLTGLINRYSFEIICNNIFTDEEGPVEGNVLLYMDLDGFKIINDTCGHLAGDQLLQNITELFKQNIRRTDVCARIGGDEFGIILMGCSLKKAESIAEQICNDVGQFRFAWGERTFNAGINIGIAAINPLASNSVEKLIQQADEACCFAKNKGRNTCHIFSDKDVRVLGMYGTRDFALTLNEALQNNQIILYGQPIVSLCKDLQEERLEVLVRIHDRNGNLILPGKFIPAASRYKLLTALDRKVIESFFIGLSAHEFATSCNRFNINLSSPTMNDFSFIDFIKQMIEKYGIKPDTLCFEIMETVAIDHFKSTIEFIKQLKAIGCEFAIDDFGSGVTTFTYIKLLPVDYIKIDQSFIQNCLINKVDEAIIESVVKIAGLLNIKTIAEGVENQEVFDRVHTLGVDLIQGFYIAKPASLR